MATSPIYSWPEPDNTDLVKNGALAIRTLGNAIDTTMGTMVAKTIIDAKGDLIAGSAADTALRLAVGSNGETLVADSSTSTGLRYTAGTVQSNPIINSAMQNWQRGTSIALTTSAYTADRWQGYRAVAGSTVSRQTTSDSTNLPFIQYCARVQRDVSNTALNKIYFSQSVETTNSIPFAGKTVTLSFYARAGANYSSASSGLDVALKSGTGTDQNITTTGYTGSANIVSTTQAITTTWTRYTFSGTVATTATEIGTELSYTPVGTAGANDYFEITGVQIDIGSVALPFRTYAGTIQGELAACQRYYATMTGDNLVAVGNAWAATSADSTVYFPMTMRTTPTVTLPTAGVGAGQLTYLTSGRTTPGTIGTLTASWITTTKFSVAGSGYTAVFTQGQAVPLWFTTPGNVYTASAEL